MQRGLATRKLSVRLSVKRVICEKNERKFAHILIPHERTFILVLETRRMLGRGDPFYLKLWVKVTLLERNRQFSIDIRS